ncbi:MAG TPA: adenylate/guanylate cyclase domain-containing protein, partial [Candidatus Ozemobacteraceae bacterium]|nr:adenylate/guanylate cyclase domain-containing protein [Candidatus Ozemobacteraceae bacterium]
CSTSPMPDFLLKDIEIPCDSNAYMMIKYVGSVQRIGENPPVFPSVSFYECFDADHLRACASAATDPKIAAKFNPSNAHINTLQRRDFGNRICLAGPFEATDFDFYSTPLSIHTPFNKLKEQLVGLEIHANAVQNIIDREFLRAPNMYEMLLLLILGTLLLGLLFDRFSPGTGVFLMFSGITIVTVLAYHSYHAWGRIMVISPCLVSFPLTCAMTVLTNYFRQRAKANTTKAMFSRFVSKDVVQYMLEHPDMVKPGGQKVEMTVFFSDVAGFTSISEALTPEELVVLLNEYLGTMTDILFKYGGTLDKFIGDAVMAFWNFPKSQPDHAIRACLCALEMQTTIDELQKGWAKRGLPKVAARCGLNTAHVVVGYMGSIKAQMNFTCMGDGVNLASRLEGANKEYGTMKMISDATYQQAKDRVSVRFLDYLAVKGKKEPVKVHELVCEKGKEPPDWPEFIEMYDTAIRLHLDRKWDEAIAKFEELLVRWPNDGPSKTYIGRCREYKTNPPPENWDGSYHLTHK